MRWIKELSSCQTFQIFLLLEQIQEYDNCRNVIFEVIFMRDWESALIFQLKNKGAKEVLHEAITKFYLMIFKCEVKL